MSSIDPEIDAMAKCHELLKSLDVDSKIRVLQWLVGKFELNTHNAIWRNQQPSNENNSPGVKAIPVVSNETNSVSDIPYEITSDKRTIESFNSIAEMFAEASPKYDWQKVLVAGAYLQTKNGLAEITSYTVNNELKNMGHGVSEMSKAFDASMAKKPQLVIQIRKDGKSKQGKKKYKITGEGIKYVNSMLSNSGNEG